MKTAAHQARLAGDKNRAKLKADVGLVARDAVEEVLNKLAAAVRPGGQCTAPAEILSAGASTSSSSTQFDNPGAEQLQAHRKWRDELETCRLELQGKGRAPPSGKYVLPASLKKVHLKMDAIKKLYSDMVTRTNFAAPKPKMLRIDMEDAVSQDSVPGARRPRGARGSGCWWTRHGGIVTRHRRRRSCRLDLLHARGVVYIARELVDR